MKTYELQKTSHKEIFRVVDRNGDWEYYYHAPSKTYLRAVNAILNAGYAKGTRFYEWLKNKSAEESDKILKSAGERGDRIHQAIRILIESEKVNRAMKVLAEDNKTETTLSNDEWDALLSFAEFWNRHECVSMAQEFVVYNLQMGFAGTGDAIIKPTKACGVKSCGCEPIIGKWGLPDWKSGGGIYSNYGAQVAAYWHAYMTTDEAKVGLQWTGILRVGTNHKTTGGYELEVYDLEETARHLEEFKAALTIANAEHKPFNPDKEIYEIPDIITLVKPVEKVEPKSKAKRKGRVAKKQANENTKRPK